jgi:hypothetical protein
VRKKNPVAPCTRAARLMAIPTLYAGYCGVTSAVGDVRDTSARSKEHRRFARIWALSGNNDTGGDRSGVGESRAPRRAVSLVCRVTRAARLHVLGGLGTALFRMTIESI